MAKRSTVHTYAIAAKDAEHQFSGFCDMLRYDAARVLEADSSLIILQGDRSPTEGRWSSFAIPVLSYAVSHDGAAPIGWLREQAGKKLPTTTTR